MPAQACVQGAPAGCPARCISPGAPEPLLLPSVFSHTCSLAQAPASVKGPPAPPQGGPQRLAWCWAPPLLRLSGLSQALGLNLNSPRNSEEGVALVCPAGEGCSGPCLPPARRPLSSWGGCPVWGGQAWGLPQGRRVT